MKLWQKNTEELNKFIETFETKDDLVLDQKLAIYDVYGSLAHAKMLHMIGILSQKEIKTVEQGLLRIRQLIKQNKFILEPGDEDIHSKIESYVTEHYGEVGKKIHTGRSRNDQVLTALRLYSKDMLLTIWKELLMITESFHTFSKQYEFLPMPGYTHMQKAMPSSVGMWANSFVESFLDDVISLRAAYTLTDKSPLGSAAAYGVPLSLDRQLTSDLLGFKKIQYNPIYCQNSRGKIEAASIHALVSILLTINKFATDVLFFTTSELNYFSVSQSICSGSSIMPQKKNVDVAELLRSKVNILMGQYVQMVSLSSNLISGYNRDLQDSKKTLIEAFELAQGSIKAATVLITNITPNKDSLEKALTPEIFATHQALALVAKGTSFREAYKKVGNAPELFPNVNFKEALQQSTHIGGTGNLMLAYFDKKITQAKFSYNKEKKSFHTAIHNIAG